MIRADQIPDESFDAAMAVAVKDGLRASIAVVLSDETAALEEGRT